MESQADSKLSQKDFSVKVKFEYLDGLRGLASLTVVITHIVQAFYNQPISLAGLHLLFPLNLLCSSSLPVCVFFVLSGFVLSYGFFNKSFDFNYVLESCLKRHLRLFIPIIAACLICFALVKINFIIYPKLADFMTISPPWTDFGNQSSADFQFPKFLINILKLKQSLNPVLWTMATEIRGSFYVFFTLFGVCALKKFNLLTWRYLLYFMVGTAFLLMKDFFYFGFIAGLVIADLQYQNKFKTNEPFAWLIFIFAVLGIYFWENYAIHTFSAILILLALLMSANLKEIFSVKIMIWLGKISFMLYLIHCLVMFSVGSGIIYFCFKFLNILINQAILTGSCITFIVSLLLAHLLSPIDCLAINYSRSFGKWLLSYSQRLSAFWAAK